MRPSEARRLHQVADPDDAVGVKTIDRLIEDQRVGVAEQGRGDPEPLTHSEREGPHPLARHVAEPDDVEHLADPAAVDAVAVGQPLEMVGGAPATDDRLGVQQRPDRPERVVQLAIGLAVDQHRAGTRRVQAQDHPHRGRLARPVGAQEPGHASRLDDEGDLVDRNRLSVTLRQLLRLDHCSSFPRCPWCWSEACARGLR